MLTKHSNLIVWLVDGVLVAQVSRFLAALAAVPLWSAGGMVATVWVAWACQLAGVWDAPSI
jgi:hypothetical protein